jgi:hypothetical protein
MKKSALIGLLVAVLVITGVGVVGFLVHGNDVRATATESICEAC